MKFEIDIQVPRTAKKGELMLLLKLLSWKSGRFCF